MEMLINMTVCTWALSGGRVEGREVETRGKKRDF